MRNQSTSSQDPAAPPAAAPMWAFLDRVLPGKAPAMVELRQRLMEFALNPATKHLLIRGPSGAGKSTVARAVAALERVAMLTADEATKVLDNLKLEGGNLVSLRSLSEWYVELSLTGLVETLADVQLFGATEGAFTGAVSGPGIFEKAAKGNMPGAATAAAELTGGVVFLDEVGDTTPALQGKLLAILSGGSMHRVGGEGDPKHEVRFDGTVVSATWKPLEPSHFRPDLLARLAGSEVRVPGLGERTEDMGTIIELVVADVLRGVRARIDHAARTAPAVMDRDYWRSWGDDLSTLDEPAMGMLIATDWSRHGHMRGLTAAVRRIVAFRESTAAVLASLPVIADGAVVGRSMDTVYDRLLRRAANGGGLAAHLRDLALEDATRLRGILRDPLRQMRLAETLGISQEKFRMQVNDLGRTRRTGEAA